MNGWKPPRPAYRGRLLVPALLLAAVACGEREAPAPPATQAVAAPAGADSTPSSPDTLVGDSLMARDTLWPPNP